jgi:3-dehydroquinate dehydratase-2
MEARVTRILVIHGPNLNLLGEREPEIYGHTTLDQINQELVALGQPLGLEVLVVHSNHEGEIIDIIHREGVTCAGLIVNAGAYSHYSYAIRDAISATRLRAIEVHLSNVFAREEFRRHSVIAPVCVGQVTGLGPEGYRAALRWFADHRE